MGCAASKQFADNKSENKKESRKSIASSSKSSPRSGLKKQYSRSPSLFSVAEDQPAEGEVVVDYDAVKARVAEEKRKENAELMASFKAKAELKKSKKKAIKKCCVMCKCELLEEDALETICEPATPLSPIVEPIEEENSAEEAGWTESVDAEERKEESADKADKKKHRVLRRQTSTLASSMSLGDGMYVCEDCKEEMLGKTNKTIKEKHDAEKARKMSLIAAGDEKLANLEKEMEVEKAELKKFDRQMSNMYDKNGRSMASSLTGYVARTRSSLNTSVAAPARASLNKSKASSVASLNKSTASSVAVATPVVRETKASALRREKATAAAAAAFKNNVNKNRVGATATKTGLRR